MLQSGRSPRPACLFAAPGALAAAQRDEPDPAQGRRAAGGVPGIGEPGGVVDALRHVHRRVVVRRERDGARSAEYEDARPELLDGVLRARAARIHRARGRGRLPNRRQRLAQIMVLRSGSYPPTDREGTPVDLT